MWGASGVAGSFPDVRKQEREGETGAQPQEAALPSQGSPAHPFPADPTGEGGVLGSDMG